MTIGDAQLWLPLFPEGLIPQILDLVVDTWHAIEKPAADAHEVPITRQFKCALKQRKDFRRLPVRIEREPAEDDGESGEELGRIDLKFNPAESALEEVYFAFECKRLYALVSGTVRALTSEYVSEGMMRFVTGQYGAAMTHGGMIGYVLKGPTARARTQVAKSVSALAAGLRIVSGTGLDPSELRPDVNDVRQTRHLRPNGLEQRLHHIFLAAGNAS